MSNPVENLCNRLLMSGYAVSAGRMTYALQDEGLELRPAGSAAPLMCAGCLARQLRDGTEPKPAITFVNVVGAACEEHFAYGLKRYGAGDAGYIMMSVAP